VNLARKSLAALAALAFLAACSSSSSKSGSSSSSSSSSSGSANAALQAAIASTAIAEQGTNRPVNPTSRPAAKGKHIVVISSGQASISSMVPSDAAVAAAKAIGWQVDLYDAKLNPANYAPLVRQAIAAGANGIVLDAIDCDTVKPELQQARAKGVAIVGIYAFDCNDPLGGNDPTGEYSAQINFGPKAKNIDTFTESYGADQANYIIAASHNTAKVIVIQDPEFTVLKYTAIGFDAQIAKSGGSQVVDTLNITAADILQPNELIAKIQAELLRFPQANWIKSPYTYATILGIVPALGAKAGQIHVMGGEGFSPELDAIRKGTVTAANVISSEWTGWASIDTMNSVFLGQKPVDSGIGWTIVDATHGLPASGEFIPPVDFKSAYEKAWGVS